MPSTKTHYLGFSVFNIKCFGQHGSLQLYNYKFPEDIL